MDSGLGDGISEWVFEARPPQGFTSNTGAWREWAVPRVPGSGRRFAFFFFSAISSGAGGGGGASGASGTIRGGGGGGASGNRTQLLIPAAFLPEVLYIHVPPGGPGGAADTDGTDGGICIIAPKPAYTAGESLLVSGTFVAAKGLKGTSIAAGTGGLAGGSTTLATAKTWNAGIHLITILGQGGKNAGAITGAAGVDAVNLGATQGTGGAGGGSTPASDADFAGGAVTSLPTMIVPGGSLPGGLAGGGRGVNGLWGPVWFSGGSGGGTNGAAGVGGEGGAGGIGDGGAGGGGGVTGGKGGDGGPGLVYIRGFM